MAVLQTGFSNAYARLCHFVAIRKDATSVTAAEDGVVRATVYFSDKVTARDLLEIQENAKTFFSLSFSTEEIDHSVGRLIDAGQLVRNSDGSVTLTRAAVSALEHGVDASQTLERGVRAEWVEWLTGANLLPKDHDQSEIWRALQAYLAAMFTRHGVQTLELLAPAAVANESLDDLASEILDDVVKSHLPRLAPASGRKLLQSFLTDRTELRDRYLSELLDGTFSFFALTVDDETRRLLSENLPSLKLFVDTNFIFGLLELHDNPFVALSKQLADVIREQDFPFQLYYHPLTALEFRWVMDYYHRRLAGSRWPPAMSRALLRASQLNSIELKYHQLNSKQAVSVDDFFARYSNLERLLGLAGVKPFRNSYEPWLEDQVTLDLTSQYKGFLEPREKPFNVLRHDIILWRTLQMVRHSQDGLLGEDAFFLTCDYTFWHFDHKHLSRNSVAVSVLPNVLLQLLRPFVPRTGDFDRSFVNTFALPEFRTIHTANPQAVLRVAGIIRLYADLPEDVAVAILTDDALLTQVTKLDDSDPTVSDLIESAIVAEAAKWKDEADRLGEQVRQEQLMRTIASDSLVEAKKAAELHVDALGLVQQQLVGERQTRESLEAKATADEIERESERTEHAQETRRLRWLVSALGHLLLAVGGTAALMRYVELTVYGHNAVVTGASIYAVVAVAVEWTSWFRRRRQRLLARILWMLSCAAGIGAAIIGTKDMTKWAILIGAVVTLITALITALFQSD